VAEVVVAGMAVVEAVAVENKSFQQSALLNQK